MSTTFRPAPWTAGDGNGHHIGEDIEILHDGIGPIATVLGSDSFPCLDDADYDKADAEAQANAQLIAAAPDLLAALQAADYAEILRRLDGDRFWDLLAVAFPDIAAHPAYQPVTAPQNSRYRPHTAEWDAFGAALVRVTQLREAAMKKATKVVPHA